MGINVKKDIQRKKNTGQSSYFVKFTFPLNKTEKHIINKHDEFTNVYPLQYIHFELWKNTFTKMHKLRVFVLNDQREKDEQLTKRKTDTHRALKGKMASGKEKKCYISLIFDGSRKSESPPPFPSNKKPTWICRVELENQSSPDIKNGCKVKQNVWCNCIKCTTRLTSGQVVCMDHWSSVLNKGSNL